MKTRKTQINQKAGSHRTNQDGFTLIEMLVVIAVLVLIMSIMMPALGRAKEQSRQMVCQSNLRQQGALMMAYAANNNETYPVAPRYYPFGGLINWRNRTCWMRTYQPASQMVLYSQGYVDEPSLFYCPSAKAGTANYITQEDHWDKPAQQFSESNRFHLRSYYTFVTYATWVGYGYDTTGEPTISRYQPKTEDMKLIQKRATKNAMSRGDTVLLSDIIQESMGSDAPKLNNHSRKGNPVGGNIQYNDGSVQWNRFDNTEALLEIPTIESCFRL